MTNSTTETAAVSRTTVYLADINKQWLSSHPRGERTNVLNEAIERMRLEEERQQKKEQLLNTFDNLPCYETNGVEVQEVLDEVRNRNILDTLVNSDNDDSSLSESDE